MNIIEALGALIVLIVGICVVGLILALPVLWLWNGCLVGAVDGIREITWLQAWGIQILCGILFKTSISKKD